MDINYDKEADAVYIKLKKGVFFKNKKLNDHTIIDLDKNNDILGLELLEVSKRMPQKSISQVTLRNMVAIESK
jgi:uncharacterized protein YuzE